MDQFNLSPEEVRVFRLLKRTAILLLLMLRLDRPVGEAEVSRVLEINVETARSHLRSLASIGLIARASFHSGWTLTFAGRQLVLTPPAIQISLPAENPRLEPAENPREPAESAGRILAASSSAFDSLLLEAEEEEEEVLTQPAENPRVGSSKRIRIDDNLSAFDRYGIGPTRTVKEISSMNHVTPDYIHSQAERLSKEDRFSTGLLLTVIRSGDRGGGFKKNGACIYCGCTPAGYHYEDCPELEEEG